MECGRNFRRAVHHLFAEQAKQTPDAIAIDGPGGSVSYATLDRRSDIVAGALRAVGVKPRDIVVIALERTPHVLVAYLGILKAGAAYCSLDLADPPARHQWTLEDSRPSALITTRQLDQSLPEAAIPRLHLDEIAEDAFPPAPPADVDLNDPACVMYTSGSTGRPKAALIPHRGIVRLFAEDTFVPFGPQLRMLAHSPMHFDAITYEAWGPLLHGGATVLFAGGAVPSLRALREHISRYHVNTLFFGPALFNLIVDEDVHLLEGIQTMMVGGDALSAGHIRKAQSHLPNTRFINAYGPTEATTFATMYDIPRPFSPEAASVPIGTPITRTSCYVLNEQLQPVKDGEEGQLFIGGDGVALGYLNLPEQTAERFLPDPFAGDPAARMYRTGDLCRRLPDGNIDFLGRIDGQVKIGGRRIEPGEIEAAVERYRGVAQCIVAILVEGPERHIVCYYVLQKGDGLPAESGDAGFSEIDLRTYLKQRLPSYLVPRDLVAISEIPRKASGKIDRRALPPPPKRRSGPGAGGPASTPEEELLLGLWRQSLDDPQLGPDSCFYEAGGTSLGAVRLCCAIERHTGKFIDIGTLAANSTPRRLAVRLFKDADDQPQTVLRLNSQTSSTTLFCIPGKLWNPNSLKPIASHLEGFVTAVSVGLPGLDDAQDLLRDTRATAAYALKQIRAHQPNGPYYLLGYSYGGVIAFEIAVQLQAAGERVGALMLLDAHLPSTEGMFKPGWQRALIHARQILRGGPRLLSSRIRDRRRRLQGPKNPAAPDDKAALLFKHAQRICEEAFLDYRAESYTGDVLLLRADDRLEWMQFTNELPLGGWPGVVKGHLQVENVSGHHHALLDEPHAADVARQVRNQLLRIGATKPSVSVQIHASIAASKGAKSPASKCSVWTFRDPGNFSS
jgi:amino acid adenylation domain-containing protein